MEKEVTELSRKIWKWISEEPGTETETMGVVAVAMAMDVRNEAAKQHKEGEGDPSLTSLPNQVFASMIWASG